MWVLPLILLCYASAILAATPSQWRNRIVYQVLTDRFARTDGSTTAPCNINDRKYCGGTWQGLINKLDYIKNMGFTAVWISPVTANFEGSSGYGEAFHGYWQTKLNSLNSHFGSENDLKQLSSALHARGMYLMVDVVPNHFGYPGNQNSVDWSLFEPFNNSGWFHKYCPITQQDYEGNQNNVENCWLGDPKVQLPDVNTENQDVVDIYGTWISNLVRTYGIDGLRIDTVKHISKGFWAGFNTASGVYCVGEVASGDPAYTIPYQDVLDGVLNYPLYYPLLRAFSSTTGSMSDLANMLNQIKDQAPDSTLLAPFLENHDQPRFASFTSDKTLAKNAIAFTLLGDGIPIIYAGQEHSFTGGNDPYNREATWFSGYSATSEQYTFIARVNQLRNRAMFEDGQFVNYKAWPIYWDQSTIVVRKGFDGFHLVGVYSNRGANGAAYTLAVPNTGFTAGQVVVDVVGCGTATGAQGGRLDVRMEKGMPRVFYPADRLVGSGICGR